MWVLLLNDIVYAGPYEGTLRCDACGRFISYESLQEGYAVRRLLYPDSHFTSEEYETLCAKHK
jgi:hypothetical protein